MHIKQFKDISLSHYSYAILSACESKVILIDPSRDIMPYLDFAKQHDAKITGIIETHPHADFISGHLELHLKTGAIIYCAEGLGAEYPHVSFDEGDSLTIGKIKLKALNTPGHSPDSISIVLEFEDVDKAVFTGDTLFIGDCGRPDLREGAGNFKVKKEELAKQMYYSLRNKLLPLANEVIVYPAHGAGTLCGKSLSDANSSTIGNERISNWSLKEMTEIDFIARLLADQPFVPEYFPFDVGVNRIGAETLNIALNKVPIGNMIRCSSDADRLDPNMIIIDARPSDLFNSGYLRNAINIMEDGRFETWLGSLVHPKEPFYIAAGNRAALDRLLLRIAKIGYEPFIKEAFVLDKGNLQSTILNIDHFKAHSKDYTILDIRNAAEVKDKPIFEDALHITLPELRRSGLEIPLDKPIVVHCAGGYRSAAGSSLLRIILPESTLIYDLSGAIKDFE
ncbi:MAG: MBL fold metallo-hydrolase [Sphingobacteriaceae bacterium]